MAEELHMAPRDWDMQRQLEEQLHKSCMTCRQLKAKCDGTRPCSNCQESQDKAQTCESIRSSCDDDYYQSYLADTKYGKVIRDLQAPVRVTIHRLPAQSSMGNLDRLNNDVLNMALDFLDFQSLARLSQTSLPARKMVEALPAYREVLTHAPETITALSKTGLLKYHAAGEIRRMLKSEACVSCNEHSGRYLSLPTCERVCFDCLTLNRITSVAFAKKWFRLVDRQLKNIPVILTIPGVYDLVRRRRVFHLVSVRQVKQLAIQVHGAAALRALKPQVTKPRRGDPRSHACAWLAMSFFDQPLSPSDDGDEDGDGEAVSIDRNIQGDYRSGMAAILFPPWSRTKNAPDDTECRCKN